MEAEKVTPIGEWVLLQPEKGPQKTSGGLYIPQNTKEKTCRGKVLATGPGRVTERGIRVEPEVRRGDRVIYLEHNIAQGVKRVSDEAGPVLIPGSEIIAVVME